MKALIIEDEKAAVRNLMALLGEVDPDIEVIDVLDSITDSVEWFQSHPMPELIFLDIHLADGSAFEIFGHVDISCPVIFTTAYDEYALKAFKVNSVDYLLKPITLTSLERALGKLRLFSPEERLAHIRRTNDTIQGRHVIKSLLIMLTDKFYPLQVEDIQYFYTMNEKVTAYTSDGKLHPVDRTLDALGDQLDEKHFFRANRQFIISRKAIKDIDLWFGSRLSVNLTLPIPERIIISKTKTPVFKKWILMEE